MMTDPIADMLTRIRNANSIKRPAAEMPGTKLKAAIAQVLKDEGFILDYQMGSYVETEGHTDFQAGAPEGEAAAKPVLRVFLKYGEDGEKVIRHIGRASKPGRRYYKGARDLRRVLDGLGIAILTTSKGVLSDRQAKAKGVGGEVICNVW